MIRCAVLGDGPAAEEFLDRVAECSEIRVSMVYSEGLDRAGALARRYGADRYSSRLQDVRCAGDVDAVYIASRDCLHFEHTASMISAGKHVLCHNRAADSGHDLQELIRLAGERQVSLCETIGMEFSLAASGIRKALSRLGTLQSARFLCCRFPLEDRVHEEALTDYESRCIQPMVQLFGVPGEITAEPVIREKGREAAGSFLSRYDNIEVEIMYSRISGCRIPSQITGQKGRLIIRDLNDPCRIYFCGEGGVREPLALCPHTSLMDYKIKKWTAHIRSSLDWRASLAASLMRFQVMDTVRKQTAG